MTSENPTDELDVAKSGDDETSAAAEVSESGALTAGDVDGTDDNNAPAKPRNPVLRRTLRRVRARIGMILLTTAFITSAGLASWLYFFEYRPDQQTDSAAAMAVRDAASDGSAALLTYSPDNLEKDFAAAETHLTGGFLSYYTQFTEQVVLPAAKKKSVKSSASVVRSAVAEMHADSAVVFVFVNKITTSRDNPGGESAASAVKVGMKKIGGSWLISSFDPV
jgi:Mce-associated membrane protein